MTQTDSSVKTVWTPLEGSMDLSRTDTQASRGLPSRRIRKRQARNQEGPSNNDNPEPNPIVSQPSSSPSSAPTPIPLPASTSPLTPVASGSLLLSDSPVSSPTNLISIPSNSSPLLESLLFSTTASTFSASTSAPPSISSLSSLITSFSATTIGGLSETGGSREAAKSSSTLQMGLGLGLSLGLALLATFGIIIFLLRRRRTPKPTDNRKPDSWDGVYEKYDDTYYEADGNPLAELEGRELPAEMQAREQGGR